MADPRVSNPVYRKANHSPLMQALNTRQTGDVINACPFGCKDDQLDEHGFCGHLIGFYNGGRTFEPRVVRKKDKRIIVDGASRQPMRSGYVLVKITTTARVYSRDQVSDLCPKSNVHIKEVRDTMAREKELMEFADRVRNPVLEGEWDDSVYNSPGIPLAAVATDNQKP